jgi:hypothetical protein
LVKGQQGSFFTGSVRLNNRESQWFSGLALKADQKGRQVALAVAKAQPKGRGCSGVDFIGWQQFRLQTFDIIHPGQTGYTHESQ